MTGTPARAAHLHRLAFTGAALLATGGLALAPAAAGADAHTGADARAGQTRAAPFDLDGDGHGELAVGTPYAGVEQVTVLRGTATGVTTRGARLLSQDTAGVPGVAEGDDLWGRSVTSGDFDADGHADLAVGALNEDHHDNDSAQGAVTLLRGTANGVGVAGARVIRPSQLGIPDAWGGGLAVGDLDGDGYDDLVVTPGYPPDDFHDAGVISRRFNGVTVLYGSPQGLSTTRVKRLTAAGGRGRQVADDSFGYSVAVGDVTGDGRDDLAVSDQVNGLLVWHGRAGMLADRADESLSGGATIGLALGDFDGDGHTDLAGNAGFADPAVAVLPGTATGLDPTRRTVLTSPRPSAEFDDFGRSLAAGDLDGDGDDELAAAAYGAPVGGASEAGGVAVFAGSPSGLRQAGAQWWTHDSAGVPGAAERGDGFGYRMRVVDQGRSRLPDLVVSAPGEGVGTRPRAGSATVLYGRLGSGLAGTGAQSFHQDTPGVPGTARSEDEFGTLDQ